MLVSLPSGHRMPREPAIGWYIPMDGAKSDGLTGVEPPTLRLTELDTHLHCVSVF